jgi:hypothetical protein
MAPFNRRRDEALALLLAQDRLVTHCGLDSHFTCSLPSYCEHLLADLANYDHPAIIDSYDDLVALVSCFNISALILHVLGRFQDASALVKNTINFVHEVAHRKGQPGWNVLAVQPMINSARLARSVGQTKECIKTIESLRKILIDGKKGYLFGTYIDCMTARAMSELGPDAIIVLDNCYSMERLKCALIDGDLDLVRCLTSSTELQAESSLQHFQLECLLKAELVAGNYNRVLELIAASTQRKPYLYIYAIDALYDASLIAGARQLADVLAGKLKEHNEFGNPALLYSLGLRLVCLDNDDCARAICEHADSLAKQGNDHVNQMRAGTLLALIPPPHHGERTTERMEALWADILDSRHNYDRFVSCVTMRVGFGEAFGREYQQAAANLAANISLQLVSVQPAVLAYASLSDTVLIEMEASSPR